MYMYTHMSCRRKIVCFRQCQWGTGCRSGRGLSNAIVKSDFRKAVVEIWPVPFQKGVILYVELAREAGETRENGTGGTRGGRPLDPAH